MGYELDRLLSQYGVSSPSASYIGSTDGEKAVYDKYQQEYQNRMSSTPMYTNAQFFTGGNQGPSSALAPPSLAGYTRQAPMPIQVARGPATTQSIQDLYRNYLGREGSDADVASWMTTFKNGIDLPTFMQGARAELATKPESVQRTLARNYGNTVGDQWASRLVDPQEAINAERARNTTVPFVGNGYVGGNVNNVGQNGSNAASDAYVKLLTPENMSVPDWTQGRGTGGTAPSTNNEYDSLAALWTGGSKIPGLAEGYTQEDLDNFVAGKPAFGTGDYTEELSDTSTSDFMNAIIGDSENDRLGVHNPINYSDMLNSPDNSFQNGFDPNGEYVNAFTPNNVDYSSLDGFGGGWSNAFGGDGGYSGLGDGGFSASDFGGGIFGGGWSNAFGGDGGYGGYGGFSASDFGGGSFGGGGYGGYGGYGGDGGFSASFGGGGDGGYGGYAKGGLVELGRKYADGGAVEGDGLDLSKVTPAQVRELQSKDPQALQRGVAKFAQSAGQILPDDQPGIGLDISKVSPAQMRDLQRMDPQALQRGIARFALENPQDGAASPESGKGELTAMVAKYAAPAGQTAPTAMYASEYAAARDAKARATQEFNDLLTQAVSRPDEKPDMAEMYFRLAAAFGAPTKTGNFTESLGNAGKEMAEYKAANRAAQKASNDERIKYAIAGQQAKVNAATEDEKNLRQLTSDEIKDQRAQANELMKAQFQAGIPQSEAGKIAKDKGFVPGTPEYQNFVEKYTQHKLESGDYFKQAMLAIQQQGIDLRREAAARAVEDGKKLTPTEVKMKEETQDALVQMQTGYSALKKALALNPNTFDNSLAGQSQRLVMSKLTPDDPKVTATDTQERLLTQNALAGLKAAFGGNPTEGERAVMLLTQGIKSNNLETRKRAIEDAIETVKSQFKVRQQRLADINAGKYRKTSDVVSTLDEVQ